MKVPSVLVLEEGYGVYVYLDDVAEGVVGWDGNDSEGGGERVGEEVGEYDDVGVGELVDVGEVAGEGEVMGVDSVGDGEDGE